MSASGFISKSDFDNAKKKVDGLSISFSRFLSDLKSLNIDLEKELNGPKVFVFGTDMIEPIKATSNFIKKHPNLEMKIGIVDGKVTELEELNKLATIPSREGLLTMFASGLLAIPKDFAICLDLHSKNLEG